MGLFHRAERRSGPKTDVSDIELASTPNSAEQGHSKSMFGREPKVNHNGHKVTKHIEPEGESGRRGIHPFKFLVICFRSASRMSCLVNFLWPVVPVSISKYPFGNVSGSWNEEIADWEYHRLPLLSAMPVTNSTLQFSSSTISLWFPAPILWDSLDKNWPESSLELQAF
jgi:hypothetical protein